MEHELKSSNQVFAFLTAARLPTSCTFLKHYSILSKSFEVLEKKFPIEPHILLEKIEKSMSDYIFRTFDNVDAGRNRFDDSIYDTFLDKSDRKYNTVMLLHEGKNIKETF